MTDPIASAVDTVAVYGHRVRQARIMRGKTAAAITRELGWKSARLYRLEKTLTATVSATECENMVAALGFPRSFFTASPTCRVYPSDLLFPFPARVMSLTEKEYLAEFAALAGEFLDELNARTALPPVRLPALPAELQAERAARMVRQAWGVELNAPIEDLTREIERSGVTIIVRRTLIPSAKRIFGDEDSTGKLDKHLGYSVRTGKLGGRPLIVMRQSRSWERTRWALAHEIGHLALHGHGHVSGAKEEQANVFASELLAPAEVLASEVSRAPSLGDLWPVKAKWGISVGALLRHLYVSELLDRKRFESLQRQLYSRVNPDTDTTWGRVEPGWNDREVERPRLVSKWVEIGLSARSAAMLAPYGLPWPQDMLEEFLYGQRSQANGVAPAVWRRGGGQVVPLRPGNGFRVTT
ncbi:DNA-binding protein [Mycobacterium sp. CBMA 213]|uniref:IrrE N-terminal-like domain-containing protein n=2 Tax=Mycolicibacterium sp. CBMA 213 TaxID=1968788 RepID=A0A343VRQ3_9MYCO|nr:MULTISPECIES: XRE family transcriptional regulator [unclassified Mycolicibacterium]AVN58577.1 hypothetical protein B5P44_p00282 [Mycolicibacterium sp. CBMA 213]MUL61217.1 ImmA/IrrE family metallo-endopeptidase [Mycolicibacterium sp. CBMA 335]MUM03454.1 DNA-binding protein [Mycolicibacterium sp. CBMA 213]